MKKSNLETGMLVRTEAGKLGIVLINITKYRSTSWLEESAIVSNGDASNYYRPFSHINEDLTDNADKGSDIVEVWDYANNLSGLSLSTIGRKLLWKRPANKVQLTKDYSATVNKENKTVAVGCQTIPFEKVEELYHLIKKK